MPRHELLVQVREFIRHPHAFPGGYTKILIMDDGEVLCADCARSNYKLISDSTRNNSRDGWEAGGVDLYLEGPPINCAHCGKQIESDYGDPESTESDDVDEQQNNLEG